jgi:2-polyprenyl-3-methyl-5-hydroxy-6-metoxy-1,4-benzoquinol methylase
MKNLEDTYWKQQIEIYDELPFEPNKKYESWQPARWSSNRAIIRRIGDVINENINDSIELGAGSAAFSFELNRRFNNKLFAIDKSRLALEFGKKISKDLGIKINYELSDFFKGSSEKKFDMVLSLGVIEHFEEKEQIRFIKKCYDMSKKYVLIAIPNQDSSIFKNYVFWANKNNNLYEKKHEVLDLNKLKEILISSNFKILMIDGFQILLSKRDFWAETNTMNKDTIRIKEEFLKKNKEIGEKFPTYDFKYEDIDLMSEIEYNFSKEFRMRNSFMGVILAKKIEVNDNEA